MFTTTLISPAMLRSMTTLYVVLQKFLMVAGLVFVTGLVAVQMGHAGLVDGLKSLVLAEEPQSIDELEDVPAVSGVDSATLSPKMRAALDFVSRKYRVSDEALVPIFAAAQATGRELHLDPLLIVAVIGVESGFNPFSQSTFGAQGLMQVVPRFHLDKLPDESDQAAFLDPVVNVQVGARVLKESIRRNGGLENGLQQFAGALNDPARRYATKVLAEKQRLEQAPRQRAT